jgi:hypothetical protein
MGERGAEGTTPKSQEPAHREECRDAPAGSVPRLGPTSADPREKTGLYNDDPLTRYLRTSNFELRTIRF